MTKLVEALEEKNQMLLEEAVEKDLQIKSLSDSLRCNPTDEKIFEGKIAALEAESEKQKATTYELNEKVAKLVEENNQLKDDARANKLALDLSQNACVSSERQLQLKQNELK